MAATRFNDLTEFLGEAVGEPIELPIRGKVYRFPASVPLTMGLRLRKIRQDLDERRKAGQVNASSVVVEDEVALYRELIGEERMAELDADGVTWAEFRHVGNTLFIAYTFGIAVGELTWTGQLGKAATGVGEAQPAANRATRRATKTSSSSPSGSTRRRSPQATSSRGGPRSTKRSGS